MTERMPGAAFLVAVVALSAPAGFAHGAERAGSALLVYSDSDNVTVYKPVATGSLDVGPATARARWSSDFISAASVDLVSSASPRGFKERRDEGQAGAGWDFGQGTHADAEATVSREPDYKSQSGSLSAAAEFLDRRLIGAGGLGLAFAEVGRTGDTQAWRSRVSQDAHLQVSAVLTPGRIVDVGWSVQHLDGYQASLYRYVRLFSGTESQHGSAVAESTPSQRWRHAATVKLRQRLAANCFGHADYRFYTDTWGMVAHSLGGRAVWSLTPSWTVEAQVRGHSQTGVSFYRGRYETLPQAPLYRTADKELGPMWTAMAGLRLEYSLHLGRGQLLRLGVGSDVLHMRYLDYAFLAARTALVTVVDLAWER